MIRKKMVYVVILAGLLVACSGSRAEQNLGQQPNIGNAIWDKPVNGEENAARYREFWKARIVAFAKSSDLAPKQAFCPDHIVCQNYLTKLRLGDFEVFAPTVFSASDIRAVTDTQAYLSARRCSDFYFEYGSGVSRVESALRETPLVIPTKNFALYDFSNALHLSASDHGVYGFRAERFVVHDPPTPDKPFAKGGSIKVVSTSHCTVHLLQISENILANNKPLPAEAIGEFLLFDDTLVFFSASVMQSEIKGRDGVDIGSIYIWSVSPTHAPQILAGMDGRLDEGK